MTTDHTTDESRIAYEPDHAVDVALDVALELADDPQVVQYIRRAQQSRVRVLDETDLCPECGREVRPHSLEATILWCDHCETGHYRGDVGNRNRHRENEPTASLDVEGVGTL